MKIHASKMIIHCLVMVFCLYALKGSATNYYSDPSAAGSMTNPGTFNAPWASLSSIFSANKTFLAGDTIFLRSGNHGYAIIKGVNSGYVVITPQPGENPVISRIRISNAATTAAAYWKLYQLTVQSESTGTAGVPAYYLIEIYPYATNICISNCTVSSNLNTDGWGRDDWRNRCNNGIFTRGKLNANHTIENNLIKNTAFGIAIASSNTVVRGNTVQNFTNDGSRVLGSYILFEKNRVMDLIKVMTTAENHDDMFQAFTYAPGGTGQDTLKNDTIRNNIFITVTDTTRTFRGPAQGIGCFDGVFLNWFIENNIVMTDHWHGISMYGAVDCRISNNTVMDPYLITPVDPFDNNSTNIGPAWIRIDKKSTGPASTGNVVKNNLVANNVFITAPSMGIASNNLVLGALSNFSTHFVDVSDFRFPGNFDLHLKPGSTAIDAGDSINAPLVDYDGVPRPQGMAFDIGAYEYVPATSITENKEETIDWTLSPNPCQDKLSIILNTFEYNAQFRIYDALGRLVLASDITSGSTTIDTNALNPGIYFCTLMTGLKQQQLKPVKIIKE